MIFSTPLQGFAQDLAAYRIFHSTGRPADFSRLVEEVQQADVVFFGELHGNPIAHRLQLALARALHAKNPQLQLAMEMFEADNQLVLDEYLQGLIPEKHLLSEAKVWPGYPTDYKPLLDFAREQGLPVIASNIPRRYANLVYRQGLEALDSLSAEARRWIAPLPIVVDLQLPGYQAMLHSMGGHGNPASSENLVKAQAIKDATMAHFILQHLEKGKILHLNGAYHSKNREGIVWYLLQQQPELRIATITTLEQQGVKKLEKANRNTADFILVVQEKVQ
ncbi:ChaN family lipoprotein [Cesiribacter andamanensis]|nr:ChaN family lipoprotein [Cesiribacter andamanensis]